MARRRRNKGPVCPNCSTELRKEFEFCPHCGQENHDLRVPFKHFLYEFVENITHFDTKLWNTLKVIFTKPGQITKDYVEGKRARYVNPARFYVFVSIAFFILMSWQFKWEMDRMATHPVNAGVPEDSIRTRLSGLKEILPDSSIRAIGWDKAELERLPIGVPIDAPQYREVAERLRHPSPWQLDSLLLGLKGDTLNGIRDRLLQSLALLPEADSLNVPYRVRFRGGDRYFRKRWEETVLRRGNLTNAEADSIVALRSPGAGWFGKRVGRRHVQLDGDLSFNEDTLILDMLNKYMPYGMFFLMPFAALLLQWCFARKRYYWEHLIFSVHAHTIIFMVFIITMPLDIALGEAYSDWSWLLLLLVWLPYLIIALRRVYGRSLGVTIARLFLMSIPYFAALLLTLIAPMFLVLFLG